jgi:RNA recognition motif-containing protein
LKGKTLNVSKTISKDDVTDRNSLKTVLITNLSFRVTESLLTDYITNSYCAGDASKIEKVSLAKDERGSSKGFAFVQFADIETARAVLDVKEFSLQGRLALIKQSKREIVEKKPQTAL